MGLLDGFKKSSKESRERLEEERDWAVNHKGCSITLEDFYINIRFWRSEIQVFYKDIRKIEKKATHIEMKTITDDYRIAPNKIRAASEMLDDLHKQILSKMNGEKIPAQQTSPSFCGNCGNPLNGENFCPNCGAKVKK